MAERIEGLGELRRAFDALDAEVRQRAARRIVMAGAAVLRKEARAIVQREGLIRTRALINNIVVKRERRAPPDTEQYHLGVRHGRALGRKASRYLTVGRAGRVVVRRMNDPFYWRFLEFGHKIIPRASKANRASITVRRRNPTHFVEPTPFIRPALENKKLEALDAMEKQALRILNPKK